MNIVQAQQLADIANYIRPIKKCNKLHGIGTSQDTPACLICNAIRGGFIDGNIRKVDFSCGFAAYFSVGTSEAMSVLFHNHLIWGEDTTGENYYTACKELLTKYGYAHLLDKFEQTPGAEVVMEFLKKELVTV